MMATQLRYMQETSQTIILIFFLCRQEEFYKLLAKHNMLPPAGWAKSRLEQKEENS